MNKKLVSAIITTHNRAPQTVLRAVNSVLNQTYDCIEIIVVDDSAPDFPQRKDVEDAVLSASDRINYIKHSSCQGACVARNTGLSHSNGYYVAFLDDDDEWIPNKIEEQLKGFNDYRIALVYGDIIIIDEIENKEYVMQKPHKTGYVYNELLKGGFIGSTSNPLIKKECIDRVGYFDTSLQSAQDYDLWLRLAKRYSVSCIEKPVINYHVHSRDRISTNLKKQIQGKERIIEKYCEDLRKDNKVWHIRNRDLVVLCAQQRWKKKALLPLIRCIKTNPFGVIDNSRLLWLILFGFDSFPYKTLKKAKDSLNDLLHKR